VDNEPEVDGEFRMKKDFYDGKVSTNEFFRDIATAVMENIVRQKEKRDREEKTAVKEEKKVDLEQLRSYVLLAWDPLDNKKLKIFARL
jgi:hypothetical protein